MEVLRRIIILLVISIFLVSCDDVITLHLDNEDIKVDFVKCENSTCIIVKTDKYCDIELDWYMEIFYKDENGKNKNIKIKKCEKMNGSRTKFRISLDEDLKTGIKYKTCTDHDKLICYFDFEYTLNE